MRKNRKNVFNWIGQNLIKVFVTQLKRCDESDVWHPIETPTNFGTNSPNTFSFEKGRLHSHLLSNFLFYDAIVGISRFSGRKENNYFYFYFFNYYYFLSNRKWWFSQEINIFNTSVWFSVSFRIIISLQYSSGLLRVLCYW